MNPGPFFLAMSVLYSPFALYHVNYINPTVNICYSLLNSICTLGHHLLCTFVRTGVVSLKSK